ncbi:MAG: DsbA family protein [Woeseiaceae bacterium]|nr:DsbA family protein [Woeseiaceae bacterium]
MKHWIALSLALLVLAACGKNEPAQPQPAEQAATDATAVEQPVAVTEPEPQEEVAEAIVVEESAAEPEEGEQAIVLAQAEVPAANYDWQFEEGKHYVRLVPAQPTWGGADKIEVTEFFYYLCPHCYNFEPLLQEWQETKPANVRFVQVPAMWNQILILHARMYFTAEALARNGIIDDAVAFHAAVYSEIHRRNNRLTSEAAVQSLFERFNVSEEDFTSTWNSFEVDQKLRISADLARRYSVSSTPTVVVNGKYRFGAPEAGSYPKVIEVIDELILRESAR